jgi:hypothetical protein
MMLTWFASVHGDVHPVSQSARAVASGFLFVLLCDE